ncbi:MAG: AbrB family transcriptional regulator [Rhodospirillaceae bacterium]
MSPKADQPHGPDDDPDAPPARSRPKEPLGRWLMLIAFSLAIGTVGAIVFQWIKMPLAWMIGAMVFTTIAALSGAPIRGSSRLRSFVVPILGIMLGSGFSPEVLGRVHLWVPSVTAMLVFVVVSIASVAIYFYRVIGYGPVTAFFSASPGSLATMIVIGTEYGGDERRIALTHSVRVMLTVLIIPIYFRVFEGYVPGGFDQLGSITHLSLRDGLILGACALGFPLFKILRLPSAQILGPMVLSACVHIAGLTTAKPPVELLNLAQLVIGTGLGARFAGVSIVRLFGVMSAAVGSTVFIVGLATLCAFGLSRATGLPFEAIWLAFAPGGLAEMTLISLTMGIDVAFVATHHLVRVTFVVIAAPLVFELLRRRWGISEDPSRHGF